MLCIEGGGCSHSVARNNRNRLDQNGVISPQSLRNRQRLIFHRFVGRGVRTARPCKTHFQNDFSDDSFVYLVRGSVSEVGIFETTSEQVDAMFISRMGTRRCPQPNAVDRQPSFVATLETKNGSSVWRISLLY